MDYFKDVPDIKGDKADERECYHDKKTDCIIDYRILFRGMCA